MNFPDWMILERNRKTCNWIPTYGFVTGLATTIGATRICEVGVAYGYHAEQILDTLREIEYQGVDPYLAGYDPTDCFVTDVARMFSDDPQRAMDRLYRTVADKLNWYDGRANLLRRPSAVAASRMADESFDLVYLDGDHTYPGVTADLQAWYGKVRPGGVLCGDDFTWQSVREAVMRFMGEKGKAVIGHSSPNAPFPEKWSVVI